MRLIRAKLAKSTGRPDDAVIGAVALLTIADSLQSDPTTAASHFDALSSMLALRGGYESFATLAVLQRVIAWFV
ncbi:hypothetical protein LTR09_008733 [Extremus antarcticus]|uniref:Uncharacterized protein n=1 Tax=Extremus antarcticus TaxID=702011 RepID=A0AAJ0DA53_9PEZI|nr:hypothetical protein LTR09_008733 [Extremus antarcticus]